MARKKSVIKNSYNEELIKLIKIVIIVGVVITLVYFLTSYLSKSGKFSTKYEPSETPEAVMTYEDATIGTVFNRPDSEYYVAFEDFADKNKTYINSLISSYTSEKESLPVYKVDMSLDINKKYKSDTSNKNATKTSELKIKTPTLIKIENAKITKYIEGNENIKSELK